MALAKYQKENPSIPLSLDHDSSSAIIEYSNRCFSINQPTMQETIKDKDTMP
jgi:hypothetical protein